MQLSRRHAPLLGLATFVAFGLAAAYPHAARAQTIDPFQSGTFTYTASTGGSAGGDQTAADIVGGDRAVALYSPPSYGSTITATLPSSGGGATVGPGYAAADFGYGYRYNGGGSLAGSPATELHLDLSGDNGVTFTFSNVTGPLRIIANIQNDTGAGISNNGPNSFLVSSSGTYVLPFSALTEDYGAINLANVNYLDFDFQPNVGASFTLDNIGGSPTVAPTPEPSTVAAFAFTGLFAAGLMLRARKRRMA